MTPERRQELAEQLGLDKPPIPRMPVPEENRPIPSWFKPKFYKALQLVDQIETWAFERFIPDTCVIDQTLDARILDPERSVAVLIRTDVPPPSNEVIHRAVGIKPNDSSPENFYRWLAIEVRRAYSEWGARAMAPPLVFRTSGRRKKHGPTIIPFVGVITQFELGKGPANVGCIVPREDANVTVLLEESEKT